MKRLLLVFALSFSAQSFATCLDLLPETPLERDKQLKTVRFQLQAAKEMEKIYAELANDAQDTNDYSIAVGTASVTPLVAIGGSSIGFTSRMAMILFGVTADFQLGSVGGVAPTGAFVFLATLFAPSVGTAYVSFDAIQGVLKNYNFSEEEIGYFEKEFLQSPGRAKCSYASSFKELEGLKEKVFTNEFDGSIKNLILDHVLLGKVSRDGTRKLYAIAAVKRTLLEKQLIELENLNLN